MNDTKAELEVTVFTFKLNKKNEIDQIALECGDEMVRLLPYHCWYTPIEPIWAHVKGKVAKKN